MHEALIRWCALFAAMAAPSLGCGAKTGLPVPEVAVALKVKVGTLRQVDKVDLLLVIDNSLSMTDKQSELARRMPQLVKALTNTEIDPKTGKPKYRPVLDLHVGVITSSLGSFGTSACSPVVTNKHNDDHSHLLPREGEVASGGFIVKTDGGEPIPAPCPTPIASTPLSWVFDPASDPKAMFSGANTEPMQAAISCVVATTREDGCGYENTWESMRRFLVDPVPYASAAVKCTFGVSGDACGNNKIIVSGIDKEILAQRAAFLRPDSLLAVVVLSDENDFSIKPTGLNWIPWGYGGGQMQRGWAACANVPDDFEPETNEELDLVHTKYGCFSCFENAADPNCKVPWAKDKLNNDIDGRNERGFHQVQRFGFNFLWGRKRYVDAFTQPTVLGSDGKSGPNAIFAGGLRTGDLIIVAGIVGVPKPLVANADGSPKELTDADWIKIAGPLAQRDPHMIESIAPRTDLGVKKYAGDRSVDPISGGERDILTGDDLQYACIGKRSVTEKAHDCDGPSPETRTPLCDPGGTQPYFKAYPGLRHLRILRDLGPLGYAASICSDEYASAVHGITERVRAVISGKCLRTNLTADSSGALPCVLYESFSGPTIFGKTRCEEIGPGYCTPGAKPCRVESEQIEASTKVHFPISVGGIVDEEVALQTDSGNVYAIASDGKKHLVCEVMQLSAPRVSSAEALRCATDEAFTPTTGGGFCFSTNRALIGDLCAKFGSTGKLRFFGATEPKDGSEIFALCGG